MSTHDFSVADQLSCPAFSPAEYRPGSMRGNKGVVALHMLVLDLDEVSEDDVLGVCATIQEIGCAGLLYTSWSHATKPWRCRVVIPLSRPVKPEQWSTLWPRANELFGGVADPKCVDPARLYFGPFAPAGTEDEHFSAVFEGEPLDVDSLLSVQGEPAATPSARTVRVEREDLRAVAARWKRRKDPYLRQMARKLREVCDGEAFAPHGERDDTCFRLGCLLAQEFPDADADQIAAHFASSLDLMAREAAGCPTVDDVAEKIARKQREIAAERAEELPGLITTDEGTPKRILANVLHVMAEHAEWQDVLAYDEFAECVVKVQPPPARDQDVASAGERTGDWTDEDSVRTAAWFASEIGFEPTTRQVDDAVATIARKHLVHPVRDYLSTLEWDGVPRLDQLLPLYFGTDDNEYTRAVGSRWAISAVARVFEPGCQVDCMLVLESERQGVRKSTGLEALAGKEWFADTGILVGDKDSYQVLRRKWIYELGELDAIKGREATRVKNFISARSDTYRPSYARRACDFPRQNVFAGTTNEERYLVDRTGNRRFWPARCVRPVDVEAILADRDQLWAEARTRYQAGEAYHVDTPELRALCEAEQRDREVADDWIPVVRTWLQKPTVRSANFFAEREYVDLAAGVTTLTVLTGALDVPVDRITSAQTTRVGHVLRELGYRPKLVRVPGGHERRYFRVSDDDTKEGLT
ncbi:MAG: hypothetical protein IT377_01400 [Polyangiaceae bacterium]|nr:hypothetical protein [Polyangiaceae bacterium]